MLTNSKWSHRRSLGVHLVNVCEATRKRLGIDLVAVFMSEFSSLCTGSGNLSTGVRYHKEPFVLANRLGSQCLR